VDNFELIHDRYARAIFEIAEENDELDTVMRELEVFGYEWVFDGEFRKLMAHPLMSKKDRKDIFRKLSDQAVFSKSVLYLLEVLVDNKREDMIHGIFLRFRDLYEIKKGRIRVIVETATEINKAKKKELTDVLRKKFNREVDLDLRQNKDLIGGFYVRCDDYLYDASVKKKLDKLKEVLR
jgi:F-type H+-transporting ATPase subunit delta